MRVSLFIFTLVSPSSEATIHPVHSPATARSFTPHLCVVQLSRCPKKYRRTSDWHCCSPFTVLSIPCPSPSSSTSLFSVIQSPPWHTVFTTSSSSSKSSLQFSLHIPIRPSTWLYPQLQRVSEYPIPSFKLTNKMPQEIERGEHECPKHYSRNVHPITVFRCLPSSTRRVVVVISIEKKLTLGSIFSDS